MKLCQRLVVVLCLVPAMASAERGSLFAGTAAAPLISMTGSREAAARGGSLFVGQASSGLFAPWPERAPEEVQPVAAVVAPQAITLPPGMRGSSGQVALLQDLIASVEAGRMGYDAVQHGARVRPDRLPTQMRIADIDAWVRATPGQPHAIGRYQFIPSTFRRLVRELGVPADAQFTPAVQDLMAERLLEQAGLTDFRTGAIGRTTFMNNIAKVWAGLPNSSGQSHYHGYAGNAAGMTWARYENAMLGIFPGSRA